MNSSMLDSETINMTGGPGHVGVQLVAEGRLKQVDLDRALAVNHRNAAGIGPLLVRLGLVSDRELAECYSSIHHLALLGDEDFPEMPLEECGLSTRFIKEANIIPLLVDDTHITIACADPDDTYTLQAVKMALGKTVQCRVATLTQIERAFDQLYGEGQSRMDDIVEEIKTDDEGSGIDSIERLRDLAAEAPIIRLVNMIINRAVELRASDIHIEPFENTLKVRYRIDGVLQSTESPPARSTAAVISRIKIMARMNIAERRLPQDGRIQLRAHGKMIDLRISTVPTLYGESLVLRILDKQQLNLDFDSLGFDRAIIARIEHNLSLPHGIILVTGPTGSGKTTTLYAALQQLNTPERKILTVEDPVEYQIDGINQIQVKPQIGLNFAEALRSIVRQDPDVIMIGEMRDLETARIAVQSALTGHLVFSTLHTNDAGSSITRLLDMGVEDYLLTSTLNGILAQRLLRTLCKRCREPYTPMPEVVERLKLERFAPADQITLYQATGCTHCAGTGYMGRSVIAELLVLSESIRHLILSHADGSRIEKTAIEEGMDNMQADGLKKAVNGMTTIEEVTRVTQE
jgi:general secretion pathway protein E